MRAGPSRCLLVALSLLFASLYAHAEDLPKVYLYTENYGTFNYALDGGNYAHFRDDIGGSATDIVKKMMAAADVDYRLRLRTWSVSYERALERPNYGVYSTARTELREELFHWIGPVGQYSWILLAKPGHNLNIRSENDLANLRIGGYDGDAATTYLQDKGFEVSTLPNESLNAQRLHQDLIDVWITSDINGYKLAEEAGYEVEEAFRLRTVGLYLAMNRETDPRLLEELQTAYDQLLASGDIQLE